MNTPILSKSERQEFETAWKSVPARQKRPASAYLLHAILLDPHPLKGFTPVSNANKLANGQERYQGYRKALHELDRMPQLHTVWPSLMGPGFGPGRFERVNKAAHERIQALKLEAL